MALVAPADSSYNCWAHVLDEHRIYHEEDVLALVAEAKQRRPGMDDFPALGWYLCENSSAPGVFLYAGPDGGTWKVKHTGKAIGCCLYQDPVYKCCESKLGEGKTITHAPQDLSGTYYGIYIGLFAKSQIP